ncbi:MAG: FdtA/QdtA family cupin domain-containing protein [Fusobacterium varium]|uniref:sugar 3,4-ketoisomerase n=1 Tax=Fusobacterium varium TaxID=856 RepID=UPI0024322C4A|nr:FdtA/QdtA family cupin domain-containing protein [Fusobacterium varium]UYI79865.1 MAG: FdtA/QdtA family cupin domain-containing protein [Fusobacterium varium]
MKKYKIIDFKELGDLRGKLVVVEGMKDIPFEIKRIFYIYGTKPNVIRGQHANKISRFILINLSGECKVKVNDGKNEEVFILNKPNQGIYLDRMVWKDMYDFSEDSILLALSDSEYINDEYIKDIEEIKTLER